MDRQKQLELAQQILQKNGVAPTSSTGDVSLQEKYAKAFPAQPAPVAPKKGIIGRTVDNVKEAVKDPLTVIPQRIAESMGTDKPLTSFDENGKLVANKEQAQKLVDFTGGFTGGGSAVSKTKETVKAVIENRQIGKIKDSLLNIEEKITPKATIKEAKLAQSQNRLIKGKEPTLLRGGTPDQVIPTDKTLRSSETILREIPNAPKLKETELYTAITNRTTEIAQNLKPEMQKVPIRTETVESITNKWEALKKTQMEVADATEEANVRKLQEAFESRLQKSKAGTMDDLWDTAKEYDASVLDNVKSANSLSSESLQNKKEIWLQNRAILRDAINDTTNGMGDTSRQAFIDMHDMYNAKEAILSKAKIQTGGGASKIRQWVNKNPVKAGAIGTVLLGGSALGTVNKIKGELGL